MNFLKVNIPMQASTETKKQSITIPQSFPQSLLPLLLPQRNHYYDF